MECFFPDPALLVGYITPYWQCPDLKADVVDRIV